jgi:hypothetical protein
MGGESGTIRKRILFCAVCSLDPLAANWWRVTVLSNTGCYGLAVVSCGFALAAALPLGFSVLLLLSRCNREPPFRGHGARHPLGSALYV